MQPDEGPGWLAVRPGRIGQGLGHAADHDEPGATLPRARALACAAYLVEQAGSYTTAEGYCKEALAIAQAAGDEYLIADLLEIRAFIMLRQGQHDAAMPLGNLGNAELSTGDLDSARGHLHESLNDLALGT